MFREAEIIRLARSLLQARRRKGATVGKGQRGCPSWQVGVKQVIREVVDRQKWSSTQSIKALTREVNRLGEWMDAVSDETVQRALETIYKDERLIPSLCDYDLIGFQTGDDAFNFSRYLTRECGLHVAISISS